MEPLPLLSVIVAIYNSEKFLSDCLGSLEKVNGPFEALLIDDGSTDSSALICANYTSRNQKFHYYKKTNGGLSDARNFGLSLAKGRFVCFLDSDDCVLTDGLSNFLQTISETPSDTQVFSFSVILVEGGEKRIIGLRAKRKISGLSYLRKYSHKKDFLVMSQSYIYLLSFIKENGLSFTKGILHEDVDLTPRLLACAKNVQIVDNPYYVYIIRPGSITTSADNFEKRFLSFSKIITNYSRFGSRFSKHDRRLLCSIVASSYLSCFVVSPFSVAKRYIFRKFVFASQFGPKSVLKSILFLLSTFLYYHINHFLKKNKN